MLGAPCRFLYHCLATSKRFRSLTRSCYSSPNHDSTRTSVGGVISFARNIGMSSTVAADRNCNTTNGGGGDDKEIILKPLRKAVKEQVIM